MRALREERGLSLRALERPTLSSKSTLHNIETGAVAPSMETARLIDEALGAGGELAGMVRRENQITTVDQLVAALRTLGCEGPAMAGDVLDQVDVAWPREIRDQVLRAMAVERRDPTESSPGA